MIMTNHCISVFKHCSIWRQTKTNSAVKKLWPLSVECQLSGSLTGWRKEIWRRTPHKCGLTSGRVTNQANSLIVCAALSLKATQFDGHGLLQLKKKIMSTVSFHQQVSDWQQEAPQVERLLSHVQQQYPNNSNVSQPTTIKMGTDKVSETSRGQFDDRRQQSSRTTNQWQTLGRHGKICIS